jgi:hypothetical protein
MLKIILKFACYLLIFIYQSVAFSMGPEIEDGVACLRAASSDQQSVLASFQPAGKGSMFYLGSSAAYRITSPVYLSSREATYYFINNNGDTGPDGICMKCSKDKCLLSKDWKRSPNDFPSDCSDLKKTLGFRKVEMADVRGSGTRPGELGISTFISQIIRQMEPPKNLTEARQLKDHLNAIRTGCKALVDAQRAMDLKNGFGDDIMDALEDRASDLKKEFKISAWPESPSIDKKQIDETPTKGAH